VAVRANGDGVLDDVGSPAREPTAMVGLKVSVAFWTSPRRLRDCPPELIGDDKVEVTWISSSERLE
jgi:hypothetical protein